MKKTATRFLSLALTLTIPSLSGCGRSGSPAESQTESLAESTASEANGSQIENSAAESEPASSESSSDTGSNVLVVYFSASGHTERVAETIADATGGDLFELVPETPYTNADLNYTDSSSRVVREHEDESLRDIPLVSTTPEKWEDYDTVFVGYPIWWGIAAWPVDTFAEENDFTGKTVIPFATSASSGMGQSGQLLADMAGTGDWTEGQRFSSGASDDEVKAWVASLY